MCAVTLQTEGTENQKKIHFCVHTHLLEHYIFEAQQDFLKMLMLDFASFYNCKNLEQYLGDN